MVGVLRICFFPPTEIDCIFSVNKLGSADVKLVVEEGEKTPLVVNEFDWY